MHYDKIRSYLKLAVEEGGTILTGEGVGRLVHTCPTVEYTHSTVQYTHSTVQLILYSTAHTRQYSSHSAVHTLQPQLSAHSKLHTRSTCSTSTVYPFYLFPLVHSFPTLLLYRKINLFGTLIRALFEYGFMTLSR